MKKLLLTVICGGFALSSFGQVKIIKKFENTSSDVIGTYQGINFREGGFSGLTYIPGTYNVNDTTAEFYTLSDRGVNIDAKNSACTPTYDKNFPFPAYAPKMHRVRVSGNEVVILSTTSFKRPDGTAATGLMNPTGYGSTATEAVRIDTVTGDCHTKNSKIVAKDPWGIDSEGIVVGNNNDFWICEEGGATVWNIDANGKVIKRYTPYHTTVPFYDAANEVAIDTVFKYRKNNRGFEGLAKTPNGKIYALIQSPILYPDKTTGEKSNIHRLLEIDPTTGANRMFAYLNPGDNTVGSDKISAKDWKTSDLVAINDTSFLVIEQAVSGANNQKNIYQIGISQATPVTSGYVYGGKSLEALKDAAGLAANGIKPVTKRVFFDLLANGWPAALDKAEGLTIINDSTIAVCNDNDFGQFSNGENGIATATNYLSSIYIFGLSGANKIANLKQDQDVITAVEDEQLNSVLFTVYPNPSQGSVVYFSKNVDFTLSNAIGQVVRAGENAGSVNIAGLTQGLYIVTTKAGEAVKLVIE